MLAIVGATRISFSDDDKIRERDSQAQVLLTEISGKSLEDAAQILTSEFNKTARADDKGPLGEGDEGKYDKDPKYRFDAFDCTTYVETITALMASKTVDDFKKNMDRIRYENAEVDFVKRNHFTDLDWIPNNLAQGYYSEVTDEVAGLGEVVGKEPLQLAKALIDKRGWYQKMGDGQIQGQPNLSLTDRAKLLQELRAEGRKFEPREAVVLYVELDSIFTPKVAAPEELSRRETERQALAAKYLPEDQKKLDKEFAALKLKYRVQDSDINQALLARVPTPSVVNIVRPNWDLTRDAGTHMNISHQMIAVRKNGVLYFEFPSIYEHVMKDMPASDYLAKFLLSPTIKGINILKINEMRK